MSDILKKKVFFHFGFPKTGSKFLQELFFPKHSQVNYISKQNNYLSTEPNKNPRYNFFMFPRFEKSIWKMTDNEFNNKYNELLEKFNFFYSTLDSNKCNILSNENILQQFFYKDAEYDFAKGFSRLVTLFNHSNIDLNIFLVIRNQSEIIPSFFYQANIYKALKEFSINADEIIKFFKTKKNVNTEVSKKIFDNFKYNNLYNFFSSQVKKDKIKFFLYEDLQYNKEKFFSELSNYLEIEILNSDELFKDKIHMTKKKLRYNTLSYLIYKNLKQPLKLVYKFIPKLNTLIKFLIKGGKNSEYNKIRQNSRLIKNYYRDDCLQLKEKLNLNLDNSKYF